MIGETAPEHFDAEYGFAYAKGLMARWLMTTGLPPDRAWDLARRVEDHLARSGRHRVSIEELRVLGHDVLGEHEGDETADRLRRWHDFDTLERPYLLPELVDPDALTEGLVVYVVLSVADGGDHWNRFAVRARDSERPAARYQDNLRRIRELQDHVVATARRTGTPVLANRHADATVRSVLDLIFAAVDDVLPPREPKPGVPEPCGTPHRRGSGRAGAR